MNVPSIETRVAAPSLARLRLIAQAAAARWLDPLFLQRHPGPALRGLIRALAPAVRLLQPNDRWNLGAFIDDWVRVLDVPPRYPLPAPKRIFMFCCYRGQFTHDIVLALLLAWRGHTVSLGYLPKLQSPIKDPLDDGPSAPGYLGAVLSRLTALSRGRVRCIDLGAAAAGEAACDEAFLATQVMADTIRRVRRETFDPAEPEVAAVMRRYEMLGRRAQAAARAHLGANREAIDLCLIPNGTSFENAAFCHVARQLGLPVNTLEKFAFSRVRTVTHGEPFFTFADLDRIWQRRRALGFFEEPLRSLVLDEAWALLRQRRDSTGQAWSWRYQEATQRLSAAALEQRLGVGAGRFVLVCPNVPFDAFVGWLGMFPSMRAWLVETIAALLEHPDLPVVVRAHPAEARLDFGRERIATILAEAGLDSPRIVVLPGESDINTYDLMPLCRFAAVFASTVGVEIAMHARPVLSGANVYYARCGIAVPAADRAAYFAQLARLAAAPLRPDPANAEAAAMLYFIFHYLLQWPYPYDKPSQISATPPRRLADDPAIDAYVETLDTLAMTAAEFEEALPRLMSVERIARRWRWDLAERSRGAAVDSRGLEPAAS